MSKEHKTESLNLVSLADLADILGWNKSKLAFYAKAGILCQVATVGKTGIYHKADALARMKKVSELRKDGLSIAEIVKELS